MQRAFYQRRHFSLLKQPSVALITVWQSLIARQPYCHLLYFSRCFALLVRVYQTVVFFANLVYTLFVEIVANFS